MCGWKFGVCYGQHETGYCTAVVLVSRCMTNPEEIALGSNEVHFEVSWRKQQIMGLFFYGREKYFNLVEYYDHDYVGDRD